MATRSAVVTYPGKKRAQITWSGLLDASTDVGDGQDVSRYSSVVVQVKGTFDTSASISIQGSNDGGTTYANLNDVEGAAATLTAAGIIRLAEAPALIRPNVTAGSGGSNLTVIVQAAAQ